MQNSLRINEVRLPLKPFLDMKALQYPVSGLSTGHKKRLEQLFATEVGRVSVVEGDVLFLLAAYPNDMDRDKREVVTLLAKQMRKGEDRPLSAIDLVQAPQRVIERLVFAAISLRAASRGVFPIFGRTFFRPTTIEDRLAHMAAESSVHIEDNFIRMYLTPTYIGLMKVVDSYRHERFDLELVRLCSFRGQCAMAQPEKSCPFAWPGMLGYYNQEVARDRLSSAERTSMERAFEKCPQLQSVTKVVQVRASKKATRLCAYPPYVAYAKLSAEDLQAKPAVATAYRDATLMLSGRRWQMTSNWVRDVFALTEDQFRAGRAELAMGGFTVPAEFVMSEEMPIGGASRIAGYRAVWIPEQKIINEQQNPRPQSRSGGWLFANHGAYDRNDVNRPFDRVVPYVVVPQALILQARKLLDVLSDGQYAPRLPKGDQEFHGLNSDDSQAKYRISFTNPWREEEGIFPVDGSEGDYWRAVQDIRREWNQNGQRDPSRIAIVIIPPTETEGDESSLYYKLKRVFVEEGIPSQFITFDTLADLSKPSVAFGPVLHSLWLNIYTKLGGKPWRLASELGNVHSFIGVGFALNPRAAGNHIYAGFAHVFDRYGSWVDIGSECASLTEDERKDFEGSLRYLQGNSSFKISQTVTKEIVYNALRLYQGRQTATREPAKNIVLHKLGPIYECEIIGFLEGIRRTLGTLNDCRLGILEIQQEHQVRLYGDEALGKVREDRTAYRGAALLMGTAKTCLATTGRVRRGDYTYYPGIGTPHPLLLVSHIPSEAVLRQYGCASSQFYPAHTLAGHAMALTQLHWGSTRENIRLPITALYAQKVADIVSKTGARVDSWSSVNLPWFL